MSTTIVGNSAGTGGGIAAKPDTASLQASLLTANQGGNCYALFPGPFLSAGYNFDSDGRCALRTVGDSSGLDPKIGTLANNGGDTFTHALLSTSPAIDKVPSTLCVTDDQRGILRVAQGSQTENTPCDIGAYERNDMLLLPTQTSTVVPTQTPTFVPTQTPTITPTQTTTVVPTFAVSPTATSAIVSTATPLNTCSNRCTLFLPVTHK